MMLRGTLLIALLFVCATAAQTAVGEKADGKKPVTVLLEAESFDDLGGWVIDQQFMDQMGSPVLLAHGLGRPVRDATTKVAIAQAGKYRVWVRTRDWAAPWRKPGQPWEPPGKFQLVIDGKPLPTVFGAEGAEWHWQDGGVVELRAGGVRLALKDVTGFDGRCDAIVLTTDMNLLPPNDQQPSRSAEPAGNERTELAAFRRSLLGLPEQPPDAGQFDFVVVGGGIAGTCAAITAARLGLQVALVHNRPVLGGNNSSEIRVHLQGGIHLPPYPALGGVVAELAPRRSGNAQPADVYEDEKKLQVVKAEKNLHLFLNTHVFRAEKQGDRIVAVIGRDIRTGKELRFPGRLFADCTGDGNLGFLAGADYRYGRESRGETGESLAPEKPDRQTMGTSIQWYSVPTNEPSPFPECPWAIQFNQHNYQKALAGDWNWETGFRLDQVVDFERVRDHGLRAVYGNWAYQKNHAPDKEKYANRRLEWVAYIGGKRESRRLLGDVILRQQDVDEAVEYPDASFTTTWHIDLHYPTQSDQFPGEEFRSVAQFHKIKPYALPYRCLYSRNVSNLFMAGRNISVTHVALGTVRVQRTLGMAGEVVGMAAAVCHKHSATPRDVYEKYLEDLKEHMRRGVGKGPIPAAVTPSGQPVGKLRPAQWLNSAGPNLALKAKLAVSSCLDEKQYPAANINDGRIDIGSNKGRWVSGKQLPHTVELTFDQPVCVGAMRVVTGQTAPGGAITPMQDFVLQYHDGQQWREVPGAQVAGNQQIDVSLRFKAVQSARFRLLVTAAPGDLARIWELELYAEPTEP